LEHPLLVAVLAGDGDEVRPLIAKGGDINTRCDQGASVLFGACLAGDVEMVRLLLDLGADPNLEAEEPASVFYAPKALDMVMQAQFLMDWSKYTPVFELLLSRGASESGGQVPTVADTEARRRRALDYQAGRQ
jgi:ankyrin repeat protein